MGITLISIYFERHSGYPVTHTTNFDNNLVRDKLSPGVTTGDYTSYIPTVNDPNVVYTVPALEAALQERGFQEYAGGYTPTSPWVNTLDLSIKQEIPGLFEGHKGSISFIVDNLLNLIDSSQGKVINNNFGTLRLYDVDSIDAQGRLC